MCFFHAWSIYVWIIYYLPFWGITSGLVIFTPKLAPSACRIIGRFGINPITSNYNTVSQLIFLAFSDFSFIYASQYERSRFYTDKGLLMIVLFACKQSLAVLMDSMSVLLMITYIEILVVFIFFLYICSVYNKNQKIYNLVNVGHCLQMIKHILDFFWRIWQIYQIKLVYIYTYLKMEID